MNAALLFEPDAYILEGAQMLGRRAAGAAFLRAAVAGHQGETLYGYTPHTRSAEAFRQAVREIDPSATTDWIPAARLDRLAERGVLYRPDSVLGIPAKLRLRIGPGRYSICGVTHTLASDGSLDGITGLLTAPVMPWDALICTSTAAVGVVQAVADAEADYQRWLRRAAYSPSLPMLPVIPLGVHCADYDATPAAREAARAMLGLASDEVVALFAGRLSVNGKAHPYQMYRALQAAAERTGRRLVLIQAGQFYNAAVEAIIRDATALHAPGVRSLFVDGKDDALYAAVFAGADFFVSLSDSIQETFGLTPLEAMAAGLPALVSDWNGYKDTVRDGIDGFRIPTWAPAPGVGQQMSLDSETGGVNFKFYLSRTSTTVSVDERQLVDRVCDLVSDPAMRRRMGEAGRSRARTDFDWSVIYGRYRELWAEQEAVRRHAVSNPMTAAWLAQAPRGQSGRLDPFVNFAHYPTAHIGRTTLVTLAAAGADPAAYVTLTDQSLFSLWRAPPEVVGRLVQALAAGPLPAEHLATIARVELRAAIELIARLAKMNLVTLSAPEPGRT